MYLRVATGLYVGLLCLGVVAVAGCASSTSEVPQASRLMLYNAGPGALHELLVSYPGNASANSVIPPGKVGFLAIRPPGVTDEAVKMSWKREDKRVVERTVQIGKDAPASFRGYIFLKVLDASEVEVVPISYAAYARGTRP